MSQAVNFTYERPSARDWVAEACKIAKSIQEKQLLIASLLPLSLSIDLEFGIPRVTNVRIRSRCWIRVLARC